MRESYMSRNYQGLFLTLCLACLLCTSTLIFKMNSVAISNSSIVEENTLATDVQRNIRIAVYDESNTTVPIYAIGASGSLHNNATGIVDILELARYDAELITVHNISEHCLVTANYDVFVLVDNLPRENITYLVWEFWAGGGGIMSLDGSGTFLCSMGILPPEGKDTTGNGVYWINTNDDLIINVRHPVSQSFTGIAAAPAIISTNAGYLSWDWVALSASSIGSNLVRIAYSTAHPNGIGVLAYEPDSGGNVVSISIDLETEYIPGAYPLIEDGIEWLCPRPKARIAFDFSHMPRLGIDDHDMYTQFPSEYSELRNSSVEHGYTFDKLYPTPDGNITYDRLFNGGYAGYDLLIIVLSDYAYTAQELVDIDRWVLEGNSLLIFAESGKNSLFTDAVVQVNNILENMDCQVNMDEDFIGPPPLTSQPHLTMEGTSSLYMNLCGYVNITGPDAYPLWNSTNNIHMAASEYGNGRVIVSADMNWATDDQVTNLDNAQYLTNAINWLTAANVNVLVYVDDDIGLNYYCTPVIKALNDLGQCYYITTHPDYLVTSINDQHWDLVIVDNVKLDTDSTLDDLLTYVNLGGRLLMSGYRVNYEPSHGLWSALGFEFVADAPDQDHLDLWNADHSIFNIPHNYTVGHFSPYHDYGDEGDMLDVTTGIALGGWYAIPFEGNASIVLGESGRTLYNAYLIDQFSGDEDDSTYLDNFELWENEIAFMMRPLLTHPEDVFMTEGDNEEINWLWDPPAQLYGVPLYSYEFRLNGSVEDSGFLGGAIVGGWVQRLSSLGPGLYIYDLSVTGRFGFLVNDTVIVHVDEAPTTTSTTSTIITTTTSSITTSSSNQPGELADIYLVGLVIGGAGIIVILVAIFLKFKPVPANLPQRLMKRKKV